MKPTMPAPPLPRRRGRPARSQQQVDATKNRIVDTAYRIFLREGFEAVSMRRLAAEVGCTVMTVYSYYPRKIDVLQALWSRVFDTLFEHLEQTAQTHSEPLQRLKSAARGYVRFWLDHREHYFLVFMSSNVEQSDVSVFVQHDALLNRFALFEHGIVSATQRALSEGETKLRSELLLCALNGIAHNLITISGYPWSSPDALVDAAVAAATDTNG